MGTIRAAQLAQQYTIITDAPVCGNCAHRRVVQLDAKRNEITCGVGGFRVANAATCSQHRPWQAAEAVTS